MNDVILPDFGAPCFLAYSQLPNTLIGDCCLQWSIFCNP